MHGLDGFLWQTSLDFCLFADPSKSAVIIFIYLLISLYSMLVYT